MDDVAVACPDLFAHTGEAVGARLEIGDPDDVLVAHPQRQEPPGLARHGEVGAVRTLFESRDGEKPLHEEVGIASPLVVDEPLDPELDDLVNGVRQARACRCDKRLRIDASALATRRAVRSRRGRSL